MPLNKQKGNMYGFVTHTWNVIKGKCPHDCEYCYMKIFPQGEIRFDDKELKTDLGEGNFIFVGSSTDMFAENIPKLWIEKVLAHCRNYDNTYLFQTKNPMKFYEFNDFFPNKYILGITLESNINHGRSLAQDVEARANWFANLDKFAKIRTRKMVTIEPIMEFDLIPFVIMIKKIQPEFVNIGADSKGHNLPEPSSEKIGQLIKELEKFTKVNLKDNLKRIYSQCLFKEIK